MSLRLKVECYSGYRAEERPQRFAPAETPGEWRNVSEILDQWYGPDDRFFKVRVDDGSVVILCHQEKSDSWTLTAYRRGDG